LSYLLRVGDNFHPHDRQHKYHAGEHAKALADRVRALPLKSLFLAAATNTAALMLSPHNAGATDAPQPQFQNDPKTCYDKSKVFSVMKEQGQQPVLVAQKPFPKMLDGKVVVDHTEVIYTSDTSGKNGYILVDDHCSPNIEKADAPFGIKVVERIAIVRLYNKEADGVPPATLMKNYTKNYDPQAAREECDKERKNTSSKLKHCGPHDYILEEGKREGQGVMLQAVILTDKNEPESILTVLGCTDKCPPPYEDGESIETSGAGTAYSTNIFDQVGFTQQGVDLYTRQKSVSPAAGPN
jgi:hypothetical protein